MATFTSNPGTDDNFIGTDAVADIFLFHAADLNDRDRVVGGDGPARDRLVFADAGHIYGFNMAGVSGIEQVELAQGINRLTLTALMGETALDHIVTVIGNDGDDRISAWAFTAGQSVDIIAGAGNDELYGGAGNDIFRFAIADLTSADIIGGGRGVDTLVLTDAGTITADAFANVRGVERVELVNGDNLFYVSAAMIRAADGGTLTVVGGDGDDHIEASGVLRGMNLVMLAGGGDDILHGTDGVDAFHFTVEDFNSADKIYGNGGKDKLVFTTAGTIAADAWGTVRWIEEIQLADGTNDLTLTDALGRANGLTLGIFGGSGDDRIDASRFSVRCSADISAGTGNDIVIGGAGRDIFRFAIDALTAEDIVIGNGAADTLLLSGSGGIAASAFAQVSGVERIELANGGITLALSDAVVASAGDQPLVVIGSAGADIVDGSALSKTSRLSITGSGGEDILIGGAGRDRFIFTHLADLAAVDSVRGNGGRDRIVLGEAGTIDQALLANVSEMEEIQLHAGSRLVLTDAILAQWNGELAVIGDASRDRIDASGLTGSNGLTFKASRLAPSATAAGGLVVGSAGADTFVFAERSISAQDRIIGGDGPAIDRLIVTGTSPTPNDSSFHINLTGVSGIERFELLDNTADGDSYSRINRLALTDSQFASVDSGVIQIIGSASRDAISGAALSAGHAIDVTGGLGDSLTGGAGNDIFRLNINDIYFDDSSSDNRINGGAGDDTLILSGAGLARTWNFSNIEYFRFADDLSHELDLGDQLMASYSAPFIDILGNEGADAIAFLDLITDHVKFVGRGGDDALYLGRHTATSIVADMGTGNDVFTLDYHEGAAVTVDMGAGKDRAVLNHYIAPPAAYMIDGGEGIDELFIHQDSPFPPPAPTYIDLSGVTNFERITIYGGRAGVHVKLSATENSIATISNESVTVELNGAGQTVYTSGGNDRLLGSDAGGQTLDGGYGDDFIQGGGGADILTGGGGGYNDIFAWTAASEGGDTITDFAQGQDKLQFALDGFDINGAAFDRLVTQSGSTPVNIDDADLLLFGGTVNGAADLRTQLTAMTTGADAGEGLFVAARTGDGHTHIFYTGDASGTIDGSIADIADLGAIVAPSSLTLSDFVFA